MENPEIVGDCRRLRVASHGKPLLPAEVGSDRSGTRTRARTRTRTRPRIRTRMFSGSGSDPANVRRQDRARAAFISDTDTGPIRVPGLTARWAVPRARRSSGHWRQPSGARWLQRPCGSSDCGRCSGGSGPRRLGPVPGPGLGLGRGSGPANARRRVASGRFARTAAGDGRGAGRG